MGRLKKYLWVLSSIFLVSFSAAQEDKVSGDIFQDGSSDKMNAIGEKAKKHCEEYKKLCPNGVQPPTLTNSFAKRSVGRTEMVERGWPAKRDEFPHMARIGIEKGNDVMWLCGGALISENYVLTAAHCLQWYNTSRVDHLVLLGAEVSEEDTLRSSSLNAAKGHTHRVLEAIKHPRYNRSAPYDDVALLKIDGSPIGGIRAEDKLNWTARPACLHYEGDFNLKNGKALASGWVRRGYGEYDPSVLHKVSMSVMDNSACNKLFDVRKNTFPTLPRGIDSACLCAGGIDYCLGDTGGPLQLTNYDGTCVTQLIGIASFGIRCGDRDTPAIYMRVEPYVSWIESVVWP